MCQWKRTAWQVPKGADLVAHPVKQCVLTLLDDVRKTRDVATAEVVGSYLHAIMTDFVLMHFTVKMVKLMCEVNPDYKHFVTHKKGKNALCQAK